MEFFSSSVSDAYLRLGNFEVKFRFAHRVRKYVRIGQRRNRKSLPIILDFFKIKWLGFGDRQEKHGKAPNK